MNNKTRIFWLLIPVYIIAVAFAFFMGSLKQAFSVGGDRTMYYIALGLYLLGFIFLSISKDKVSDNKNRDAFIYGVLTVAAYVFGLVLSTL